MLLRQRSIVRPAFREATMIEIRGVGSLAAMLRGRDISET